MNHKKLLTETELELMTILWDLGPSSVKAVMAELPENRNLAYTSVSTIIRILEKKGVVESQKVARTHYYKPLLERQEYESLSLNTLLNSVFDDTPVSLVKTLVDTKKISQSELAEIKKLIDARLSE